MSSQRRRSETGTPKLIFERIGEFGSGQGEEKEEEKEEEEEALIIEKTLEVKRQKR